MTTPTFTKAGAKSSVAKKLPAGVFSVPVSNHELIKQAYVSYLANGRQNLAVTKKRGEVRGGGKKPWRQKGTGKARFGSSRNPIWRGGGIAFGPTGQENYRKEMNVTAKRQALRQALSLQHKSGHIVSIEAFHVKEPKTRVVVSLLNKMNLSGQILLIVDKHDPALGKAVNNLDYVKLTTAHNLHVVEVMNADTIVVTDEALTLLTNRLSADVKKAEV